MALAVVSVLALSFASATAGTWTLKNDALKAEVSTLAGGGIGLTLLESRTGRKWVDGGSPSPLFHIDLRHERQDQPPSGYNPPTVYKVLARKDYSLSGTSEWKILGADRETRQDGTSQLRIRLARADPKVEVLLDLRCRPGKSPLEIWYEVHNPGKDTVFLDRLDSFNWRLANSAVEDSKIYTVRKGSTLPDVLHLYPKPIGSFWMKMGPVRDNAMEESVPWFAIQRPGDSGGMYGGWAFSAFGRIDFHPGREAFAITGGLDPAQLAIAVEPGETRPAPMAFLGVYEGSLDDGANDLRHYSARWLAAPTQTALPLVNYNTWTAAGMNVTEENLLAHVRMAKLLGCELFHVDAGWHPEAAEWIPDPARLPRGLAPIRRAAHQAGMKFGLWVAYAQASSVVAKAHPEWLTAPVPLNWDPPSYAGLTMCQAYPPARRHMALLLEKVVSEYELDYLEHDQAILQTCRRDFHGHSPNAGTYEQALAYYSLHEELLKRHPSLLLENCMGGGNILDYGVMQRFHLFSLTDLYDPLSNRVAIYGATFPFPARYGEGYMADSQGVSYHYQFRSYMMGYWSLSADATSWPPDKIAACKKDIAAYKKIRPILRDGDIYHILPQPDGLHWDGMEYYEPVSGRGVIFVFRPDSPEPSQVLFPRGLDRNATYQVSFEDRPESFLRTGKELMERGLPVTLSERFTAELVYLDTK